MSSIVKSTQDILPADFILNPVWEYTSFDGYLVKPVYTLPVDSLDNRIIGTKLCLNTGIEVWGVLSNFDVRSAKMNQHFLAVWIERDGKWFELARYHDVDFGKRSPEKLAEFLGLSMDDVFPIEYDISASVLGPRSTVANLIQAEPAEKLNQQELIRLAIAPEG